MNIYLKYQYGQTQSSPRNLLPLSNALSHRTSLQSCRNLEVILIYSFPSFPFSLNWGIVDVH